MGDYRYAVPVMVRRAAAAAGALLFYFHVAAVISRSLPNPDSKLKFGIVERSAESTLRNLPGWALYLNRIYIRPLLFEQYLTLTGFNQNWSMFAPNPIHTDIWIDAIVRFKSGKESVYQYPRNSLQNLIEKFWKERFSKFIDTAQVEQNAFLWPPLAEYIARESHADPSDPPIRVMLRRWVRSVAPPDPGGAEIPEPRPFVFFDTPILAERLVR